MNTETDDVFGYFIGILFLLLIGFLIGALCEANSRREDAIKAGVAHWTINPTTGKKTFEYIAPKVQP